MFKPYKLHSDLKLGVATAATQIEGGDKNNNWYRFSLEKGNVKDGSTSLRADDHYARYTEDTILMKNLGIEVYRMGIEWSRIEPRKNEFDDKAMKHYIDEINLLKENGIEVLVTLHHFSNPLWFEDEGGFTKDDSIQIFLNYVNYVVNNLKGVVKEFITINEANIYATNAFLFGNWPPKHRSIKEASKVMKNLCLCHIEAFKLIKKIDPSIKVGFANHMAMFTPTRKIDALGAKFYNDAFNNSLNRAMAKGIFTFPMGHSRKLKGDYIDFFGINYYTRNMIKNFKMYTKQEGVKHNDLGWEISSVVFNEFVTKLHDEFKKDIYITENGTADKNDAFRSEFIYDHLKVIADKEYVKRYYHWTFMDNWEWAEGESAKFGLIKVNYDTQERTIRPSGHFYSEIIKNNEINESMIKKYLEK